MNNPELEKKMITELMSKNEDVENVVSIHISGKYVFATLKIKELVLSFHCSIEITSVNFNKRTIECCASVTSFACFREKQMNAIG